MHITVYNIYTRLKNAHDFNSPASASEDSSPENGSVTLVSDMDKSSLQLVEVYDGNGWSPLCDHNWTLSDVTVVCKELEYDSECAIP